MQKHCFNEKMISAPSLIIKHFKKYFFCFFLGTSIPGLRNRFLSDDTNVSQSNTSYFEVNFPSAERLLLTAFHV